MTTKKILKNTKAKNFSLRISFSFFLTLLAITLTLVSLIILLIYFPLWCLVSILFLDAVSFLSILAGKESLDYKLPWIFIVFFLPAIGFLLFLLFYRRTISNNFLERYEASKSELVYNDQKLYESIQENPYYSLLKLIARISNTHLYLAKNLTYFPNIEEMLPNLLTDLRKAEKSIYLEFPIIKEGIFLKQMIEALKDRASYGIDIKIIYDDLSTTKLPYQFKEELDRFQIKIIEFSKIEGLFSRRYLNRLHRKMIIIDELVLYLGGFNIGDEYLNKGEQNGIWYDNALRAEGEVAYEYLRQFMLDFNLNNKDYKPKKVIRLPEDKGDSGFLLPVFDGPKPFFKDRVMKTIILNILYVAKKYVYFTTPYLVIDEELLNAFSNAQNRGIDIRIIIPMVPDKRVVYSYTRLFADELAKNGVKVYLAQNGFMHAKSFIADDVIAYIGSSNMDYLSLFHQYENGIIIFQNQIIRNLKDNYKLHFLKDQRLVVKEKQIFVSWIEEIIKILASLL